MSLCFEHANQSFYCGKNSDCLDEECCCDPGFFKLEDFTFQENYTECSGDALVFYVLYSLQLVLAVISVVAYLRRIKRKSQAKRLIPFFFVVGCFISMSGFKLSDIEGRYFGKDIGITISLALTFPFRNIASQVQLNKYIQLMYKLVPFKSRRSAIILKMLVGVLYICSALATVATGLMISTLVLEDVELIEMMLRCCFGIMVFTSFCLAGINFRFGTEIANDVEMLAKTDYKARNMLIRSRGIKWVTSVGHVITMLLYSVGAISFFGLEIYAYVVPVQGAITCIITITVVHCNKGSLGIQTTRAPSPSRVTNRHSSVGQFSMSVTATRYHQYSSSYMSIKGR